MINKKFKLFECCIAVKGAKKGIIMDLQRGDIFSVSNAILDLLEEYSNKSVYQLLKDYRHQKKVLKKYIQFFYENELIFITEDLSRFPKINTKTEKPFVIDTVVLEIDDLQKFKQKFIKEDLNSIGCKNLVLISKTFCVDNLKIVLALIEKSKVELVSAFLPFVYGLSQIKNIAKSNRRFRNITFYNAKEDLGSAKDVYPKCFYTKKDLKTILSKNIQDTNSFAINIDAYLESLNYNLFYNRRVYIDNMGNIKHNFSQLSSFGNIKVSPILDIVSQNNFKRLTRITKDQIEVCKDCEYRYCCPDNRIPIVKDKIIHHNTTCNYDPYQNTWN